MALIELNGTTINYEVEGEGEWLVLLHGFGSSIEDWEAHRPIISKGRRLLTLDFRGFGKSSRERGPFSVEQFTDDLVALMAHLGVERADVVGYSMGGAVAFQLAVSHPALIRRLVLVNTWASFEANTFRRRREKVLRTLVVKYISMPFMAKLLGGKLFGKPGQEELRATFVERYGRNSREVYLELLRNLPNWSVMSEIGAITAPTLILSAAEDYTPLSEKEEYAAMMPTAALEVVEGMGHGSPFEDVERFCERVLRFANGEEL